MIINKKYKVIGSVILAIIIIVVMFVKYSLGGRNDLKSSSEDIFIDDEIKDKSYDLPSNVSNDSNCLSQSVSNFKEIVVEIKGEVARPDVYQLEEGSIIKDLIDMAGGVTEEADLSCINRAEELVNHELIIIGNINDETESSVVQNSSVSSGNSTDNDSKSSTLININTADLEQLKKITGIGDIKAQSIIDYREANGGFKSLEELKNVDGIGDKTFEKIKEQITL